MFHCIVTFYSIHLFQNLNCTQRCSQWVYFSWNGSLLHPHGSIWEFNRNLPYKCQLNKCMCKWKCCHQSTNLLHAEFIMCKLHPLEHVYSNKKLKNCWEWCHSLPRLLYAVVFSTKSSLKQDCTSSFPNHMKGCMQYGNETGKALNDVFIRQPYLDMYGICMIAWIWR